MSPTTERFAAIDVGSNSIRCLIAEQGEDGHLQIIDDLKDQPRLARGLTATGRLAPEAIEFWQGRADRLHDRLVYRRSGGGWTIRRLAP